MKEENNQELDFIGKSEIEEWAQRKNEVYQIKSEINKFGLTDKQRYFLIYVLSQEIENIENSRLISKTILNCRPDINVLNMVEEDE